MDEEGGGIGITGLFSSMFGSFKEEKKEVPIDKILSKS